LIDLKKRKHCYILLLKKVECCCEHIRLTNKDLVRTKMEGERHGEITDMERKWIRKNKIPT
jgi:hypothetical protein